MRIVRLLLFTISSMCASVIFITADAHREEQIIYTGLSVREEFYVPELPHRNHPRYTAEAVLINQELIKTIDEIPILVTELVLGEAHRVFLTAYCAEECGWNFWTSSGAYCHRSDNENRIYEPTTAAIDLNYFSYGTMFYIPSEDRVYIAEDTGAFRGMWIDVYQDSLYDVLTYDTRYEWIYEAEYEYHYEPIGKYDVRRIIKENINEQKQDYKTDASNDRTSIFGVQKDTQEK